MSLLTRLVDPDHQAGEEKIPVHQFTAAMAEYRRGALSGASFVAMFELVGDEVTTLQNWAANIDTSGKSPEQIRTEVEDILELGEHGYYDIATVQSRLTNLGY